MHGVAVLADVVVLVLECAVAPSTLVIGTMAVLMKQQSMAAHVVGCWLLGCSGIQVRC